MKLSTVQALLVLDEPLTDREVEMLSIERQPGLRGAAKDDEVRRRLGLAAPQYRAALDALIDREPALTHDPLLVRRLRRARAARDRARATRRPDVGA